MFHDVGTPTVTSRTNRCGLIARTLLLDSYRHVGRKANAYEAAGVDKHSVADAELVSYPRVQIKLYSGVVTPAGPVREKISS